MKEDQKCKKNDFWGIFLAWPPFCRKCPFYTVKGGIFFKMVAIRGKCPKNHFFAFLVFFHINTTYIKLDWNSDNFLIFWCTLLSIHRTVLWQISLVQIGILTEASQRQERILDKLAAAIKTSEGTFYEAKVVHHVLWRPYNTILSGVVIWKPFIPF